MVTLSLLVRWVFSSLTRETRSIWCSHTQWKLPPFPTWLGVCLVAWWPCSGSPGWVCAYQEAWETSWGFRCRQIRERRCWTEGKALRGLGRHTPGSRHCLKISPCRSEPNTIVHCGTEVTFQGPGCVCMFYPRRENEQVEEVPQGGKWETYLCGRASVCFQTC